MDTNDTKELVRIIKRLGYCELQDLKHTIDMHLAALAHKSLTTPVFQNTCVIEPWTKGHQDA